MTRGDLSERGSLVLDVGRKDRATARSMVRQGLMAECWRGFRQGGQAVKDALPLVTQVECVVSDGP